MPATPTATAYSPPSFRPAPPRATSASWVGERAGLRVDRSARRAHRVPAYGPRCYPPLMSSPATVRLMGLLVIVGMAAGCGDVEVALKAPDDPLDVELRWRTHQAVTKATRHAGEPRQEMVPFLDWRLGFSPDGTFRYAWRSAAEPDASWREVTGTMERLGRSNPTWSLETDVEAQEVENDHMGGGRLPMVWWSAENSMGAATSSPSMGAMWWIQVIDHETGEFTEGFTPLPDPRCGGG